MARSAAMVERSDGHGRLRAAGLRVTGSRVAVFAQLQRARTPLSHAELVERVGHLGFDRATVYRVLIDLTEAGLARRTDVGDHVWRFELRGADRRRADAAHHPHFVCDECGDVTCLPDLRVAFESTRNTPRSLRRNAVEVQLKGRCDRCS